MALLKNKKLDDSQKWHNRCIKVSRTQLDKKTTRARVSSAVDAPVKVLDIIILIDILVYINEM